MKKLGILGTGWLGQQVATHALDKGWQVHGSVRQEEKKEELSLLGVTPSLLSLESEGVKGDIEEFLEDLKALVICLPPQLRKGQPMNFVERLRLFLKQLRPNELERIIYVSSTGVFADTPDFKTYSPQDKANGTTPRAKHLAAAEDLVHDMFHPACVVRSGGQFGINRHPIHFLSGRENVPNPGAPVNMTNGTYLATKIVDLLEKDEFPQVVHAISEPHESRIDYYTRMAHNFGVVAPKFDQESPQKGKRIVE